MRPSSVRFVRFNLHPCVGGDPIQFPSLASVVRERLFKVARSRSDVRNNKSNKDGSGIECFLIEKLAASILELADRGLAHGTAVTVGKIEAPLMGLGIVETQRQTFDATRWAIDLELYQIGAPIPNLSDHSSALIFDPSCGAS